MEDHKTYLVRYQRKDNGRTGQFFAADKGDVQAFIDARKPQWANYMLFECSMLEYWERNREGE